jgi:hypothetical protein
MNTQQKIALREKLQWLLSDVTGQVQAKTVKDALNILDDVEPEKLEVLSLLDRLTKVRVAINKIASNYGGELRNVLKDLDICLLDFKMNYESRFMSLRDSETNVDINFDVTKIIAVSMQEKNYIILLSGQHVIKVNFDGNLSDLMTLIEQRQHWALK